MAEHNITTNDSTGFNGDQEFSNKHFSAKVVSVWIFAVIEIPIMFLTLIALCFLIKSRPAASVFVSHLILSDLIQVICMLMSATAYLPDVLYGAHHYALIVGVFFMACVAFERHLLVSHPIWYKSHNSLKLSCFISMIPWFVPLIFAKIDPPCIVFSGLPQCIACLIPYPIVILCFAGTWRGLSRSISLTYLTRKLILGSSFLLLLTYTVLILPFVIVDFIRDSFEPRRIFPNSASLFLKSFYCAELLLYLNPLADCLLYLFMRADVGDMTSVHCCCRHQSSKHSQDQHSVVNQQNSCTTDPASHSLNTCSSV